MATILDDPLGRVLLDHVLITAADLRGQPELKAGLAAYVSDDGRLARIDLVQADPVFSAAALAEVNALRRRLDALLGDADWLRARAVVTGVNAQWAEIRACPWPTSGRSGSWCRSASTSSCWRLCVTPGRA